MGVRAASQKVGPIRMLGPEDAAAGGEVRLHPNPPARDVVLGMLGRDGSLLPAGGSESGEPSVHLPWPLGKAPGRDRGLGPVLRGRRSLLLQGGERRKPSKDPGTGGGRSPSGGLPCEMEARGRGRHSYSKATFLSGHTEPRGWAADPDHGGPNLRSPNHGDPDHRDPDLRIPDLRDPNLSNPDLSNPNLRDPTSATPTTGTLTFRDPDLSSPRREDPTSCFHRFSCRHRRCVQTYNPSDQPQLNLTPGQREQLSIYHESGCCFYLFICGFLSELNFYKKCASTFQKTVVLNV